MPMGGHSEERATVLAEGDATKRLLMQPASTDSLRGA
jgi:hypothetical protein